jgi:predicted DNA binding protein
MCNTISDRTTAVEQEGDREREVLRRAFEVGYFDTPRQTSLVALGDELGYDRQEVCVLLRRALRAHLAQEFE